MIPRNFPLSTFRITWISLISTALCSMVAAQQEQKDKPDLDLKQIKAHLKNLDVIYLAIPFSFMTPNTSHRLSQISLSPFEAKKTLQRLNETNQGCRDRLGSMAESDFDGGCSCLHWKYEHNSTCEDKFQRSKISSRQGTPLSSM
eukprot:757384-Hanusia_phi.AAC.2